MKLISHVQPVICRSLDHDITGWTGLGSRLASSFLFLNIKFEAAVAAFRWLRWRLDGILLSRNSRCRLRYNVGGGGGGFICSKMPLFTVFCSVAASYYFLH